MALSGSEIHIHAFEIRKVRRFVATRWGVFFFSGSGVPKGSSFGPLSFIILINDVVDVLKCHIFMYSPTI